MSGPDEKKDDKTDKPHWKKSYEAALLELDYDKLPAQLDAAHKAIHQQLLSARTSAAETQALHDARRYLAVVENEVRQWKAASGISEKHPHPEVAGKYVVFVNANREYVTFTDGVCELLGYTRSELLR